MDKTDIEYTEYLQKMNGKELTKELVEVMKRLVNSYYCAKEKALKGKI